MLHQNLWLVVNAVFMGGLFAFHVQRTWLPLNPVCEWICHYIRHALVSFQRGISLHHSQVCESVLPTYDMVGYTHTPWHSTKASHSTTGTQTHLSSHIHSHTPKYTVCAHTYTYTHTDTQTPHAHLRAESGLRLPWSRIVPVSSYSRVEICRRGKEFPECNASLTAELGKVFGPVCTHTHTHTHTPSC